MNFLTNPISGMQIQGSKILGNSFLASTLLPKSMGGKLSLEGSIPGRGKNECKGIDQELSYHRGTVQRLSGWSRASTPKRQLETRARSGKALQDIRSPSLLLSEMGSPCRLLSIVPNSDLKFKKNMMKVVLNKTPRGHIS